MFKIREVKDIRSSKLHKCPVVMYGDEDGYDKFAACVEDLLVKVGDKIEIYCDDYVSYKGFGGMVLRVVERA